MSAVVRPLIDVYVVHWCRPQWCIRSVESLKRSVDVDLRCHVIDNGGPVATRSPPPCPGVSN